MENRWLHDMNMRYMTNHGAMLSYQQKQQQHRKREGARRRKERERILNLTQSLLDEEEEVVEKLPPVLLDAWEAYLEACHAHLSPPVPVPVDEKSGKGENIDKYIETTPKQTTLKQIIIENNNETQNAFQTGSETKPEPTKTRPADTEKESG
jgi:hypothetical protein